ncbi:SH2 domain-containing protein 6 isoform X2 [Sphaeramia orbicularis]|uniref:SH2 domain-containing protein 6 isoform X2 n=1 Tax=Sphaeramia orbicularis TaxID=375764 RepID=UPI00118156BE|nr:SH2 domain-containing protein 6-like isoform X2 [Sphaeramia orbicularis]
MSFFGKLKNLGPPAPPRRTDNNAKFAWPPDEFDDEEESDMYEAPPCERTVKVPQRQVEENVYLERTSNPDVPQRQVAPPPRLSKLSTKRSEEFFPDSQTKKPPEVDRNEKPGRKKKMPPPPVRPGPVSAPTVAPASNIEEDVYLDPNEEQEDCDDELYLEPTEATLACSPPPRGPKTMPPSPKTALPSATPMMKPPVPRAKSSSLLPSVNEVKTGPPVEARWNTFPTKLPPPTPNVKPLLPANLKEAKSSPQNPSVTDIKAVASSAGLRVIKQPENESKEWFAGDCTRKMAEDLLFSVKKDGAFLIRHSSSQNSRQPYTLAVLYQEKVYNIPIRFLEDTQGYALGKEGKKNEEIFCSLDEIISHHKDNQLLLIDSKSQAKHTAYLTHPARP